MKRTCEIEVKPTPYEIAKAFCDMGSGEQADFFNYISEESEKWDNPFCFQLQSITDEERLTRGARYIMSQIGDYANPT